MSQEREIKIILKIELYEFVKRIQSKGYKLIHTLNQTDIYFDTKDWFLYENIAALRLRQVDGKDSSFSFKKVFYLPKIKDHYIEEIEVEFPIKNIIEAKKIFEKINIPFDRSVLTDGIEITKYLAKHNYFDEQKMKKSRKVYSDGVNEVVIDEVEKVGTIVELECKSDDPKKIIKTLLKDSEWTSGGVEGTGHMWLKNVKGLNSHITNFERFKSNPDWNVWENERKIYAEIQNI